MKSSFVLEERCGCKSKTGPFYSCELCYIGVDVDNSNRLALGFAHTLKVLELLKKNSRP